MTDPGPQKGPASTARIVAQTKAVEEAWQGGALTVGVDWGKGESVSTSWSPGEPQFMSDEELLRQVTLCWAMIAGIELSCEPEIEWRVPLGDPQLYVKESPIESQMLAMRKRPQNWFVKQRQKQIKFLQYPADDIPNYAGCGQRERQRRQTLAKLFVYLVDEYLKRMTNERRLDT